MPKPRLALVHDFLFTFGGAERVLLELHQLFPEAPIYTLFYHEPVIKKYFSTAEIRTSYLNRSLLKRWPRLLLSKMPQAIESFDFNGFDLVISSSGAFSHGVVTGPDTTHICYCHSPMRYAWDWHAEYLKELKLGLLGTFLAEGVLKNLRIWDYFASKRVDVWLANSQTVADRINKFYHQQSTIVFPPIRLSPSPKTESDNFTYAVSASRLSKNKKIEQIITACTLTDTPLMIIGTGREESSLKKLAAKLKSKVEFLGSVDDKTKYEIFAKASCFLFAALDDFGIAPVEALSAGIPVIAYGRGGASETVHPGQNGLLYEKQTTESLAEKLSEFKNSGVALSPAEIRASSECYSPENFRRKILEVVYNAAKN